MMAARFTETPDQRRQRRATEATEEATRLLLLAARLLSPDDRVAASAEVAIDDELLGEVSAHRFGGVLHTLRLATAELRRIKSPRVDPFWGDISAAEEMIEGWGGEFQMLGSSVVDNYDPPDPLD